MNELLQKLIPNVIIYKEKFFTACTSTLEMFLISGIFSFVLGLAVGVLLTITKKDGIKENRTVYFIIDTFINVFRAIPFLILLIFLIPFTRAMVGTAIGVTGAIGRAHV